ncbi:ubiquinone biosynthesis protein [Salipiger aestuarii]|uniref:Ubiquinone biosynthesis protein COQ9 n=1 Tax=Salipiger aestuarii TaxID=568098 RepID=A0A327XKZ7_9RHOB|nr:COQ9 family protein [Salipiger aestuarii]EIE49907.1 rpsU-divergently transcribed protein [Citreicella sp. 357]KAA8605315.1 ubiquinone biosynthesis protein [Salipiger aestuarii]KAA8607693.1 ubiquinone biosynthesis protein [Salipiger aestuarii]KAB2538579.1 ubiquinone biosynthesis protein [Salipiger aestuarii]RAK09470.1 ubiquinone biosynthesis protein COQ9 [Salipiger aestuarii]
MTDSTTNDVPGRLLDAALAHVAFDGWSDTTFRAAVADTGVNPVVARGLFPRGAVDMAVAFHRRGDARMAAKLAEMSSDGMRYRDIVARAVRTRIEIVSDREAVRRGTTLFALPIYAADGAKLIWGTADRIWDALGDTARDFNWYSKRATLAAVFSSTVLYWLGDDSPDCDATWAFLDRRIEDVMRIEKTKAKMRGNPLMKRVLAGPDKVLGQIRAPRSAARNDLPGGWTAPR